MKRFLHGNYLLKVYSKLTEATCVGITYFIIVDFELMLTKFRFFFITRVFSYPSLSVTVDLSYAFKSLTIVAKLSILDVFESPAYSSTMWKV